jgi:hypothetical protein
MKAISEYRWAAKGSHHGFKLVCVAILVLWLQACGGGDDGSGINASTFSVNPDVVFAQRATLEVDNIDQLEMVSFSIATKPGHMSEDVHVTYGMDYLQRNGAVDVAKASLSFDVFGLYAEHNNPVTIELVYTGGVTSRSEFNLLTGPFQSSTALPEITINHIDPVTPLSFIMIRSTPESPIIIDVDGETRWQAPDAGTPARAAFFDGTAFFVGSLASNNLYRIAWNGAVEQHIIGDDRYLGSHHNIEKGKVGLLNTIGFRDGAVDRPESVLIEHDATGNIIKQWDFDQLLADHILANGEDPGALVQNGVDWFHMNSAIYDASDDSIIASSRENFVIKVDYETGNIKWILGNTDKLWYTNYPLSLQPLALQITGNAPIGQHALSVTPDGRRLMLFNNGLGNLNLPDIGDSRTFSLVSIYDIDAAAGTASESWSFDHQQQIYSDVCSSAYRTARGDILIDYAAAEARLTARFMVVNDDMQVLFDATMPKRTQDGIACQTAYNIEELDLNGLVFE